MVHLIISVFSGALKSRENDLLNLKLEIISTKYFFAVSKILVFNEKHIAKEFVIFTVALQTILIKKTW